MSPHILSLPTELLAQILSFLSLPSLLRFSETSVYARALANANLHSLSLCIVLPFSRSHPCDLLSLISETGGKRPARAIQDGTSTPCIRITAPSQYNYLDLLAFQSTLLSTVLHRHAAMLQHVHLQVPALTVPMALALRTLHALKTLALGFQTPLPTRFVPRSHVAAQRTQQHLAWKTLVDGGPPVWSRRLRSLRLEDAEIETAQLGMLVSESAACDELVLEGCRNLGKEVWCELQMWIGRGRVRVLEVAECGGVLGEKALDGIGGMGGLEVCILFSSLFCLFPLLYVLIFNFGVRGLGPL
ncbi:hypothetical protein ACJBU6_10074 [Exserohilum turcicum]